MVRTRRALYGAWLKLQEHESGESPYLRELGTLVDGEFIPTKNLLPHRIR